MSGIGIVTERLLNQMALSKTYLIFLPALGLVAFLVCHLSVKIIMIFFLLSAAVSSTKNNTAERIKPENVYKNKVCVNTVEKTCSHITGFHFDGKGG